MVARTHLVTTLRTLPFLLNASFQLLSRPSAVSRSLMVVVQVQDTNYYECLELITNFQYKKKEEHIHPRVLYCRRVRPLFVTDHSQPTLNSWLVFTCKFPQATIVTTKQNGSHCLPAEDLPASTVASRKADKLQTETYNVTIVCCTQTLRSGLYQITVYRVVTSSHKHN
jgi:hypothetical protein